jgi:aminomethyltransferase
VGTVSSGNFSPVLGKGIALAFVDTAAGLEDGAPVTVDLRGTPAPGTIVRPPFVAPTPPRP